MPTTTCCYAVCGCVYVCLCCVNCIYSTHLVYAYLLGTQNDHPSLEILGASSDGEVQTEGKIYEEIVRRDSKLRINRNVRREPVLDWIGDKEERRPTGMCEERVENVATDGVRCMFFDTSKLN